MPKIPFRTLYHGLTADPKSKCVVLKFTDREPLIMWNEDCARRLVRDMIECVNAVWPPEPRWWDGQHWNDGPRLTDKMSGQPK